MKIVTANRLTDGAVVWLTHDGWSSDASAALPLSDEAAPAALAEAGQAFRAIVNPYLIDVEHAGGVIARERLRETIRARGPTTGHSLDAR